MLNHSNDQSRRVGKWGALFLFLCQFERVKEVAFQIVRFELNGAVMNGGKAIMMAPLHMNREP
jgi:hypothetical protein